jgi:hypothetical protein
VSARRLGIILFRTLSLAVFSCGVALAAWAGVQWLQTAHWQPLTINQALASWPTTRNWLNHPQTWLGLHRLVLKALRVPVFLPLTLVGTGLLIIAAL